MKDLRNFDELIRDVSESWEVKPPADSFTKIRKKVVLFTFRKKLLFTSSVLMMASLISVLLYVLIYNQKVQINNAIHSKSRNNNTFEETLTFRFKNNKISLNTSQEKISDTEQNVEFEKPPLQRNSEYYPNTDKTIRPGTAVTENKTEKNENNIGISNKTDEINIQHINSSYPYNSGNENQKTIDQNVSETNVKEWNSFYLQMIHTGKIPVNFADKIGKEVFAGKHNRKWQASATVSGTVFHYALMNEIPENSAYTSDPLINGSGASVMLSLENRNYSISSGIVYSKFNQNFSATELIYNPTLNLQIIHAGTITQIDSVSYWHYYYLSDSTIQLVDSVLEWREIINTVHLFDSAYVPHIDTLQNIQWKISFHKYEIPLTAGISKSFGRFRFGLNSGISLDLIKPVCGYLYNGKYATQPFRNLNESFSDLYLAFSMHISTSFHLTINEHFAFELTPYYKFQLNDIIVPEQNLNLKFRSYGVYSGLKYYF